MSAAHPSGRPSAALPPRARARIGDAWQHLLATVIQNEPALEGLTLAMWESYIVARHKMLSTEVPELWR